jgi:molybdate transport system permease protein
MDWSPLWISLKVSFAATAICIIFGIPIAHWVSKNRKPNAFSQSLITFPLILPPTVLGYFLLVLLGRNGVIGQTYEHIFHSPIVFTWQAAAIAAAIASMPLLITQARVAFENVDRDIQDSARVFGATELQIFAHITLPMARGGVIAGIALAFARAMGDFGATLMVAGSIPGQTRTMPIAIYEALQTGDNHTVIVFVMIASLITFAFTWAALRFQYR